MRVIILALCEFLPCRPLGVNPPEFGRLNEVVTGV
jgi:hypothetical protein